MKKIISKSLLALVGTSMVVLPTLPSKVALSQTPPSTNDQFEVRLRTFIPSPAVYLSPAALPDFVCATTPAACAYSGDNRGFSYNAGTHRSLQNAIVTVAGTGAPIIVPLRNFCPTNKYNPSQGNQVPGQPFWWWTIKPNQRPIASQTLQLTSSNNIVRAERVDANTIKVGLVLEAANPLVTSPAISSDINVFIRKQNGVAQYRVEGSHDGFPAYELYINGTRVYEFDPKARNQTPISLAPPKEWPVNINWQNVPSRFSQQRPPTCP